MSEQSRAELEQKIDEARENIRKAEVRWQLTGAFSPAPTISQPWCIPVEFSCYPLLNLKMTQHLYLCPGFYF